MTIHELVVLQRNSFLRNHPYTVDERIVALERLQESIRHRQNEIAAVLKQDLYKGEGESFLTEIGPVLQELTFAIRHLGRWAAPKRVHTPKALLPSRSFILREPYGLSLIMSPSHSPFLLSLMPLIGAVAAGNHVILKPSHLTPTVSMLLYRLIGECFPAEQVAVVPGGSLENQKLLEEKFDFIYFMGTRQAGRIVAERAARQLTPIHLELGGKSPCIVDDSADIALAARRIAFGKGIGAGQTSIAPDYVLVHSAVKQKLMEEIAACWLDFYGNAMENAQWPAMITPQQYERAMGLIANEQIFFGGVGDGNRIAPTLLDNTNWASPIMREEILAPILPVLTFDRLEDALRHLATLDKPPALYLFTRRTAAQEKVLARLSFGSGCINDTLLQFASPHLPSGGVGASGMGSMGGKYSFLAFTHEKAVLKRGRFRDLKFRYHPLLIPKIQKARKVLK